jgi:hypothetical protein
MMHLEAFQCKSWGSYMYLETVPTTYDIYGQVWVRYKRLPTICLYKVMSTNGVSPPSSSLILDKKGVGEDLQFVMWNLSRRYLTYLA